MIRLSLTISDDLLAKIDEAAISTAQSQGEVFRKAVLLYLAASDGVRAGKQLGLIDPDTGRLETRIVGL